MDGRELPGISTKIYASVKMTIDGVAPRFYHRFRKRREDILGAIEAEVVFSLNDKNEVPSRKAPRTRPALVHAFGVWGAGFWGRKMCGGRV